MPLWELNTLLDRLDRYLPHILYGVHGAEAERNAGKKVDDPSMIPGMEFAGGIG